MAAKGRKWPIEVWVCPTCGNYFGSSSTGDLNQKVATKSKGEISFPRTRCPDCGDTRVLCMFAVELVPKEVQEGVGSQEAVDPGGR